MRRVLCSAAVLMLAACDPFMVQVDEPNLCVTTPAQTFPGAPAASGSLTGGFAIDLPVGDIAGQSQVQGEAHLRSVTLTARSGIGDFAFVRSARLTVLQPDASQPVLNAVVATTMQGAPSGKTLTLEGPSVDIWPALAGGKLNVALELDGAAPTQDWSAEITTCVDLHARASP